MTPALDQLAVDLGQLSARERVLLALADLGPDELEVLAQVADGLLTGRGVYGELKLDTDPRDMASESLEEVRDALVYAGAALVRLRRAASHAERGEERRLVRAPDVETPNAPGLDRARRTR